MGISGASMTRTLETYRPLFMVVTFGFLGAAFYLTYRPRRAVGSKAADCCGPADVPAPRVRWNVMLLNKIMLWVVTAMAVVFLFFPRYVTGLFGSDGAITADMQRTVIRIEGMTCPG
jgi:hypothetical protein